MRGEKYENDIEIRLKELELKKQELELKTKELERNEKQIDAWILQGQQQTHAIMMLLGKLIEKWHLLWKMFCFLKLFLDICFVWFSLLLNFVFINVCISLYV